MHEWRRTNYYWLNKQKWARFYFAAEASLPTPSETPITPASDDPFEAFGDSKPKESISKEPQNSNPAPIQPSVSNSSNPPPLLGSLDSFNSTAAKISPRKSSLRQKSRAKDDFYSSDSDEAQSENASTSTPVKRQFKVNFFQPYRPLGLQEFRRHQQSCISQGLQIESMQISSSRCCTVDFHLSKIEPWKPRWMHWYLRMLTILQPKIWPDIKPGIPQLLMHSAKIEAAK